MYGRETSVDKIVPHPPKKYNVNNFYAVAGS